MAQQTFSLLPLILSLLFSITISASPSTNYIDDSCKATTYPVECVKLLSPYSDTIQKSPRILAQTALTVGLTEAQSSKSLVAMLIKSKKLKVDEHKALDVCLEQMDDSIDMFSQSAEELKLLEKENNNKLSWRIRNVKTWVSAALTNLDTCLDTFADKGLKGENIGKIISKTTIAKKVTSNALALVNKFARESAV